MPPTIEPFQLEQYFAAHEFETRYLLGSSDCESMSVEALLALEPGSERAFMRIPLGYTQSRGAPDLRREIAGLYEHVRRDDVLVHTGAEEAIYAFARSALAAGDRVIVQSPCYQSLLSVARAQGCDVVEWRPYAEWQWSTRELERLAVAGTRALVVNSPHNPTGHQFVEKDFRAIVRIAADRGAILFSDEVYRLSELDDKPLPAACDLWEGAVSLGVLSKSFGLPGLRIGWLASRNAALIDAVASYKDYLSMCTSAPSEFLAEVAIRRRSAILENARARLRRNREIAGEFFERQRSRFGWVEPHAGPVGFARLLVDPSADSFCAMALRGGVMLVPSSRFGYGDHHVRIGYGRENFPEALAQLEQVIGAA